MIFDTHIHTLFSTDSKMEINEAIDAANKKNIGMIITEHIDFNYPVKGKFVFDIDKYFKDYYKYRSDKVLLGVEIGMGEEIKDQNREINKNYDFDYVLGSIHLLGGKDLYEKDMYKNSDKREVFETYFETMLASLSCHTYINSLAHIDYISRYATYKDPEIYYNEYSDYIDEVLKFIVDREIAFEINTRRIGKKEICDNLIPIYKRYRELGGRFVTIGSDSHNKESIGANFENAFKIAESCNLKPVYFEKRNIKYI
ncbi:histidinol phosphate phosphatase [Clostridium felsineum]|uniref:Histidinol-phosphatase n=1 Tax=Clostridium felsineum TaxID=36839 RepID=A0A1S8KYW1_9CLOT|nr:histidinol phosphate phosphatase [Clostridium felsineum]MCR3761084.1 histidinol phosphate phosphatase [Clostridium felsineum]URZ04007.1 Histidinol-phosphatase [Clostridium felsineum]URZ07738.1 Histidinol-phosphatase [Clostridium felsineum]URZ12769.1 Histidinol-phosphatase [Clostridium felsineum]URZ15266.1 Histidinol-phosphatase [Clostridium felsineum DSM 794]